LINRKASPIRAGKPRQRPSPHFVAAVRPPRHHADTLFPEVGPGVCSAHAVVIDVRELTLDGIGVPKAAFIEYRRSGRAEPVSGHFFLFEAQPPQGGIDRVFAHAAVR
jgi:hypothetical protein